MFFFRIRRLLGSYFLVNSGSYVLQAHNKANILLFPAAWPPGIAVLPAPGPERIEIVSM
jgi:hypothetical protein